MKKTHQTSKKPYINSSRLASKAVRQSFRDMRGKSPTLVDLASLHPVYLKNVRLYRLSPYLNSRSRRLCAQQLLSHSATKRSMLAFRSRIGGGYLMLMPNLHQGKFMSNKRRRSVQFFATLSKRMRLSSPRNNLRSFIRGFLSSNKPLDYSPHSTFSSTEWQDLLAREQQSLRDLRLTRRLKRHNRIRKSPSFDLTNLADPSLTTEASSILLSSSSSKKGFSNPACVSSAISKDYIIRYIECSYVGVKDSLSRLVNS